MWGENIWVISKFLLHRKIAFLVVVTRQQILFKCRSLVEKNDYDI